MSWTKEEQPFGANHAPLLTGLSVADGETPVPVAVDPITGAIIFENASVTGGWEPYALGGTNSALTSLQTVSSSAGKFGGYMTLINLNATPAYIQVFDSTGIVTLGTTPPTIIIAIPANATAANGFGANMELSNGIVINDGIQIAATTTANGDTTVSTGIVGTVLYH